MSKKEKVFLVFNTACFGDGLVCNSLCQNIKRIYPDSKIVFIVNKPFYEVAKYQKDVDDVVILDKKGEHRGIKGILNFVKSFPYKNAYASFLTYGNFRNYWISVLTGCFRIFQSGKIIGERSAQSQILTLLSRLTSEDLEDCPIKYLPPAISQELKSLIPNNCVAVSAITKKRVKDIPVETVISLVKKLNKVGYRVLLTGVGTLNESYAEFLSAAGCEFINLVNKTTISELAGVLQSCKALISADTGTMHLGYAVGVPTIAVFYEQETLGTWAPREEMYNVKLITQNQSAENIVEALDSLLNSEEKSV